MLDLKLLKSDLPALLAELGVKSAGNHCRCIIHDGAEHMQVNVRDGVAMWKCHSSGEGGTIVDARMARDSLRSETDAIRSLEKDFGIHIAKPTEAVLDMERAIKFVQTARDHLQDSLPTHQYLRKRGLLLDECLRFNIGFLSSFSFKAWPSWHLQNAWVIPLTTIDGQLRAVKIHFETRPMVKGKPGPKCLFAPFGTEPKPPDKPIHSFKGFFPPVEMFSRDDWLYICPGELKAFRRICVGHQATSMTCGESSLPKLDALTGYPIVLVYDDDESGEKWRVKMIDHLKPVAKEIRWMTWGRKTITTPPN